MSLDCFLVDCCLVGSFLGDSLNARSTTLAPNLSPADLVKPLIASDPACLTPLEG